MISRTDSFFQEDRTCYNAIECPCLTPDCDMHGVCCQCVVNVKSKGKVPACLHPVEQA
jgi:hypothetical protein